MPKGHSRKLIEIDEAKLRELHAKGMNDGEMGKALGCSGNTARLRRIRLGLPANGRGKDRSNGMGRALPREATTRATLASKGADFRKHPRGAARAKSIAAVSNGNGTLVEVRVEVLDALWDGLEPEEKARLVNQLIEARG